MCHCGWGLPNGPQQAEEGAAGILGGAVPGQGLGAGVGPCEPAGPAALAARRWAWAQ